MSKTIAYIGIGANLGDARETVTQAIDLLDRLPQTSLIKRSSLFRTAPVDAEGDDYVNAVAQILTELLPHDLLLALLDLEQQFGRMRPYVNAPRTLDLDILLFGDQHIDSPSLTVPHPRMTMRAFVLIPLLQLDPLLHIPGQGPAHQFVPRVSDQAISVIS
ncbi:MAG: 2-amino-4-hydroxy-6-hydroxymethyldihydropteridine diphosphokinase [Oxalicibacterium faecigallinarum]|uniref:2-amino-4-hydroxy-6- hydroxymethyldihydropteridine diphosphokinase n=1 Tax=Oxalicibacterium faecigallinarum TaxID=573741 RepID=UPI002806C1E1|nr:2-amino-4-hydroxy-6-hydroxymethyldihydropteridine diphosphokinase [Oxalicibacterium faecigallinarum]MDQ7969568.1 2-amino-4-hydroxy-6-hydroxymethyldihydropteridine diphosphokinase [Oxalicibacterium faecigallinarum]